MKISSSMLPTIPSYIQAVKHDHNNSILFERNQQVYISGFLLAKNCRPRMEPFRLFDTHITSHHITSHHPTLNCFQIFLHC